ncbi:MAG TPA: glycine zipper 2TM domain-containing protein [Allosphingosinicella sp.]|jgi:uncharacterized protein YcfJ
MRKFVLALSAATLTVPAVTATPAFALDAQAHRIQTWRGSDGRVYCRKPNGTTGLLVGGAAGALIGRQVDRHGSRATGTILGAAVGALLGQQIQRSTGGRRCR